MGRKTEDKRILKSQNLTDDQYRRANRIMYVILVLSYVFFAGIDYSNAGKGTSHGRKARRTYHQRNCK